MRKDGYPFSFQPSACEQCTGRCCTGESGYIWVTFEEMENIANFLELSFSRMVKQYTYRAEGRFSLKESHQKLGEFACIFFKDGCQIYEHRPKQCRTYPFWPRFKKHPQELVAECPGIELDK